MKLVEKNTTDGKPKQCQEITSKGQQCSRDAVKMGYCKQHYHLLKERGLVVEALGNKILEEVPEPPQGLGVAGCRSWHIYCQFMIDEERLYKVCLLGIANLCFLEDQLEETKKDMADHGVVNHYDNGIQRNGYASHFDKLLTHIRSLRSDYGLTGAVKKTTSADAQSEEPGGYQKSKSKNW